MTAKARIFRAAKGKDKLYFSMRCDTAQDTSLSFEARGMLAYFLSLKDGWEITTEDLQQKCGRDKAYRIVKELRDAGYIERECTKGEDGRFIWGDYKVHEIPSGPFPEKPDTENTEVKDSKELDSKLLTDPNGSDAEASGGQVANGEFKAIQEHTVAVVFGGNDKKWGAAGDIANWALCRIGKATWFKLHPDKPFTVFEWQMFLQWYGEKKIAYPANPEKWNQQAFEFRASREYKQLLMVPTELPTTTTSQATREALVTEIT